MALFPGPPRWAGARRELLDFMVQGKINWGRHTDHPAGCHSIRTNQCLPPPSPHIFYTHNRGLCTKSSPTHIHMLSSSVHQCLAAWMKARINRWISTFTIQSDATIPSNQYLPSSPEKHSHKFHQHKLHSETIFPCRQFTQLRIRIFIHHSLISGMLQEQNIKLCLHTHPVQMHIWTQKLRWIFTLSEICITAPVYTVL